MLKTTQKITIDGQSIINDVVVSGFRAEIESNNPENMTITSWQQDKKAYKENRVQARLDEAEFEDLAYSIQDEMIADLATE